LCAIYPAVIAKVVQKPLNHRFAWTVDLIVYRPAGGAGQHESRRLRLGGKQKPAGCDSINRLVDLVAIDFDA